MAKATKKFPDSNITHIGVFGSQAPRYWAAGFTVVPDKPGTRECAVSYDGRVNNLPDDTQQAKLLAQYADHDIGLLLGQHCGDKTKRSAAIDVDDDRIVRFVREIIGPAPAKFGSKGETLFVQVDTNQKGTNIRNNELNPKQAVLELFVAGGHTVLPPSVHWKTGNPYQWTSALTLPGVPLDEWPWCEQWKLELLRKVLSWKRLPEVLDGSGTNIPMRDLVWYSVGWFGPDSAAPDGELAKRALAALLPEGYTGDTDEQLDRLVDKALEKGGYPRPDDSKTVSLARRLLEAIADSGAELFHDGSGEVFVSVRCDGGGCETLALEAQATRDWLTRLALGTGVPVVSRKTLDEVGGTLRARALEGKQREVFVRIGASELCPLVIDLGKRGDGRAIVVTADSFRVTADHGVRFVRLDGALPLPEPAASGELRTLQRLLAVDGDAWVMLLGFVLITLRPRPPYMGLMMSGPSGAGKTTRGTTLKALTDPNEVACTPLPKKENNLAVALKYERLPMFDNIAGMPQVISDMLCVAITGGGYKDRKLYTNQEQSVIRTARPLIVAGLSDYIWQPDLLSRLIPAELAEPETRLTEEQYWAEFKRIQPALLAELCRIAAGGLSRLAQTEAPTDNRNADCLRWLAACEPDTGLEPGSFEQVIGEAQNRVNSERVQNEPAFLALSAVVKDKPFVGLMSELQQQLDQQRPDQLRPPPKGFPNDGNALSKWLTKNKSALLVAGVQEERRLVERGTQVCVWCEGQDANAAWQQAATKPELTEEEREVVAWQHRQAAEMLAESRAPVGRYH